MMTYSTRDIEIVKEVLSVLGGQTIGIDRLDEESSNWIIHEPFWAIREHFGIK